MVRGLPIGLVCLLCRLLGTAKHLWVATKGVTAPATQQGILLGSCLTDAAAALPACLYTLLLTLIVAVTAAGHRWEFR